MNIDGHEIFSSRGVASKLRIGRNIMMARLRERGIFTKDNIPVVGYEDEFIKRRARQYDVITTYWTDSGLKLTAEICVDLPKIKEKIYNNKIDLALVRILNDVTVEQD